MVNQIFVIVYGNCPTNASMRCVYVGCVVCFLCFFVEFIYHRLHYSTFWGHTIDHIERIHLHWGKSRKRFSAPSLTFLNGIEPNLVRR